MANENMKYLAVIAVVVVFVVGLGVGLLLNSNNASSSPFHLTLVITDSNSYGVNNPQPAYFVLANNGTLVSSANIHIPVNTKIEVTIINYDDGNDSVASSLLNVQGTLPINGSQSNQMLVVRDEYVNSTLTPDNTTIDVSSNEKLVVSSVPSDMISHTFTVLDTNKILDSTKVTQVLNIPVERSSTSDFFVTFTHSGTYHWACEVPCGNDAMGTPGWMEGSLVVG